MIEDFTQLTTGRLTEIGGGARVHSLLADSGAGRPSRFTFHHGFGANCLSWSPVIARLTAASADARVAAYDLPGFGFSVRKSFAQVRDRCYSPQWSAAASLQLNAPTQGRCSRRVVSVGHSMGCVPAILAAAVACRGAHGNGDGDAPVPTTLVLESPALWTALSSSSSSSSVSAGPTANEVLDDVRRAVLEAGSGSRRRRRVGVLARRVMDFLLVLLTFPLRVFLRRLLSVTWVWRQLLSAGAWGDRSKLNEATVRAYQLPVRARGFELDLLRFVCSAAYVRPTVCGHSHVQILRALVSAGCEVVVIHGRNDAIVPLSNSERLASAVPGVVLHVLDRCGHVCHEEDPDAFFGLFSEVIGLAGSDS